MERYPIYKKAMRRMLSGILLFPAFALLAYGYDCLIGFGDEMLIWFCALIATVLVHIARGYLLKHCGRCPHCGARAITISEEGVAADWLEIQPYWARCRKCDMIMPTDMGRDPKGNVIVRLSDSEER